MKPHTITREWVDEIRQRLREGARIRAKLPFDGVLRLDRLLPFLCVYRKPVGRGDPLTRELLHGESLYLSFTDRADQWKRVRILIQGLLEELSAAFGACLLFEYWAKTDSDSATSRELAPEPLEFTLYATSQDASVRKTLERFEEVARKITIHKLAANVRTRVVRRVAPPNASGLVTPVFANRVNCVSMGVEIKPVYRDSARGAAYPLAFRATQRGVSRAARQAFFTFTQTMTSHHPPHYLALGPRSLTRPVWEADRRLAAIAETFDFLALVTPVNMGSSWLDFKRFNYEREPVFYYAPVNVDPSNLKRRLHSINLDRIEDPAIGALFRQKRIEIDRQITMLAERGEKSFFWDNLQLNGSVDDALWGVAEKTLMASAPTGALDQGPGKVTPNRLADRAREEIAAYRETFPGFSGKTHVSDSISGILVSRGDLYIGANDRFSTTRVKALLWHEVGVHMLTYWNAKAQPFQLLACGLPGYDEFQEGLAVFCEYLSGGLNNGRLRILAGRVMAARWIEAGASFIECFRHLAYDYAFPPYQAFYITARIYRAGGLTKDALYLRGFMKVWDYLERGGNPELLIVGKIGSKHVRLINELILRGVLNAPPSRPMCFEAMRDFSKGKGVGRKTPVLKRLIALWRGLKEDKQPCLTAQ